MEARLSLRHVWRVISAMSETVRLCDITVAVCYVTTRSAGQTAEAEWNRALLNERTKLDVSESDRCYVILKTAL